MCGIAGFFRVGQRPEPEVLRSIATSMAHAIQHRGPDAQGVWTEVESGVAIGHRRLSIIDLSESGMQPMVSPSGRYVLSYNGEIYNFRALRKSLVEQGQNLKGHSDTEVLIAAIDHWGVERTLNQINGMFAFALWDRKDKHLILARDRVGKKPLYFGWCGDTFLFASELRALRAHPDFSPVVDRTALSQLLRFGWIAEPHSIFQGIQKLTPGTFFVIDPKTPGTKIMPRPYWSAKEHVERGARHPITGTYAEAVSTLDALLRDAVTERMVSDVDLGALLSGGIDSSLVVAIMQALSDRSVKTFSVGFKDPKYDEAPYAKQIADYLGTDHHEAYLAPEEALDIVADLPRLFDEPFADVSQIPTYLVSRVARRDVTVVLSGDGGDELFAGYRRYHEILRFWHHWGWFPPTVRSAAGGALEFLGRVAWRLTGAPRGHSQTRLPAWRRIGNTWERDGYRIAASSPRDLLVRQLSSVSKPHTLLKGGAPGSSVLGDPAKWADVRDPLQGLLHLDFVGYLPDDILTKVDRASMAVSLEARSPLLDYRIAEFAWRLPRDMRIDARGGKRIMRDVLARYVPPALTERPKQGFSVPVADWLRGPLKDMAEEYLSEARLKRDGIFDAAEVRRLWHQHRSGWRKHSKLIWAVLVFQMWSDEMR